MPRRKKVDDEPKPSSSKKVKEDEPPQKKKKVKEDEPPQNKKKVKEDVPPQKKKKVKEDEPPQNKKKVKEDEPPQTRKKVKEDEPPHNKKKGKTAPKRNKKTEDDENVNPNENQVKDKKKQPLKPKSVLSFVHAYDNYRMGINCNKLRNFVLDPVMTHVKAFKWLRGECCFDNRVTFLEWHPSSPSIIAVASKNGDIILWDYNKDVETSKMIKGDGPGYSIQDMKFHPQDTDSIYTVSISGKFLKDNFETNKKTVILDTGEWMKKWFVSCDINFGGKVMVVGDNDGCATLLTTEGKIIREFKAAKAGSKINSCEFSKAAPWLLVTSTGDRSVKLWDIRKIDSEVKPLEELKQEKIINSAYFSLTDGARLLTTDQYDKITVYRGPLWHEETVIKHPHRHFQHLTPIRAYWHPLEDVIVCGRYPNNKDIIVDGDNVGTTGIRSIDFFDASNGKLLLQHYYPGFNHIVSLSKFNNIGDTLACGAGRYVVIWKPNFKEQEDSDKKFFGRSSKRGDDDDDDDDDDNKKPPKDIKINKTILFQRGSGMKEAKKINVQWKNEKK